MPLPAHGIRQARPQYIPKPSPSLGLSGILPGQPLFFPVLLIRKLTSQHFNHGIYPFAGFAGMVIPYAQEFL